MFIIFSLLGWLYEYIIFNRAEPDGITKKIFDVSLPILPIYGVGGIILLFIYEKMRDYSLIVKVITASIVINLMECVLGISSYKFYGYQTWKYDRTMIPMCYGYISLIAWIWWTFMIYIVFNSIDKTKN